MSDPSHRIVEALSLPAILIDQAGRVAVANRAAVEIFGASILKRAHTIAIRHPGLSRAIALARSSAQSSDTRISLPGHGGGESHFLARSVPLSGEDVREVLVTFQDTADGAATERMRRDFVANVSHELKTPLTGILGFLETLRGPARGDVEATRSFLDLMSIEAERMNRLVDDLLTLSRVEAMERRRPGETLDLSRVLAEVLELQGHHVKAAGQTLSRLGDTEPSLVRGDADQMQQVIVNLIANAIRHAGAGAEIKAETSVVARDPILRGPAVMLEISDTGVGFEAHHLPRLTERFYRADTHRSGGGTGLGLSIVKHIVARHRGRLSIEAAPDKGAAFRVFLPAADPV